MPKRKRSNHPTTFANRNEPRAAAAADGNADEPTRAIAMRQEAVRKKIHYADVIFRRGLKICRTFEAQKIGRRVRLVRREGGLRLFKPTKKPRSWEKEAARKEKEEKLAQREIDMAEGDPGTLQRISEEVAQEEEDGRMRGQMKRFTTEQKALKDIDLGVVSQMQLYKTLLKHKAVTSSPYFPTEKVREELEKVQGMNYCAQNSTHDKEVAARTVAARLYDANKARAAFKMGLKGIYTALGLEFEELQGSVELKKSNTNTDAEGRKEAKENVKDEDKDTNMKDVGSDESSSDGDEGEEEEGSDGGVELGDEFLNAFDARIAKSGSEGDSDGDAERENLHNGRGHSMSITPEPADPQPSKSSESESDSKSGSESESESERSPEPETKLKSKSKKRAIQAEPSPEAPAPSKSSFLPTLMSGYVSGSASDSDSNKKHKSKKQKKKGPPEKKERKNRMGQQARRALAEKKFGSGAKHIIAEKERKEEKKRAKEEKKKQWEAKQNKPVHPSWQAAKSAQEQKDKILKAAISSGSSQGANPLKGAGKKIVFSD